MAASICLTPVFFALAGPAFFVTQRRPHPPGTL